MHPIRLLNQLLADRGKIQRLSFGAKVTSNGHSCMLGLRDILLGFETANGVFQGWAINQLTHFVHQVYLISLVMN